MPLKITLILAICAFLVNLANSDSVDCSQVRGNNLKSPGWPNMYSHNVEYCDYRVRIPPGKHIVVYFHFFDLGSCQHNSLYIDDSLGDLKRFCGIRTGATYLARGGYVKLYFSTDSSVSKQGYDLYFIPLDPRKSE
ncbi:CUB and peptidase domain-containing protein 2-like [Acropora millepora]|uniref:CUB and peptidase domain-containing protein 2-like n=1 Tax=Acropora millepora TaxID=45264 RepID=UPI001CF51704|nr:CUB and peptidase domain-containing protein 2-like [Acropora millepora]